MPIRQRVGRANPELVEKFRRIIRERVDKEDLSPDERLGAIFLLMDAHGLPCDQKQREQIRKRFAEFDEAEQRRHRKKR